MQNLARAVLAAAVSISSVSGLAQAATTVTFSDLINPADGLAGTGMVYSSAGLTFTSTFVDDLNHWGSGNPFNADPGGATLLKLSDLAAFPLVVTMTGGGTFDLVSLQLAESESGPNGPAVDFSYTNGSGTFTSVLAVTVASGLQTFVINQPGVTSFSLRGADMQLDNVIYNPVPEPAAFGMLAVGLLAVWRAARQGRRPMR